MAKNRAAGGLSGGAADDPGCSFILGEDGASPAGPAYCGRPCRRGSDYCEAHHALCHLRRGGRAETMKGFAIEALAEAVGGRIARPAPAPPPGWFPRVEAAARPFFRLKRSRYVQKQRMTEEDNRNIPQPAPAPAGDEGPTPERLRHGPVERLPRPIPDAAGRPSRPYRAIDTLAIMERRGSITAAMREAGEDFRARFAVAQLDPLRATDLSHLRVAERGPQPEDEGPGLRIERARKTVWTQIQAVGGIGSPAGSCLWHVLGWEQSLKEWALGQGWSGRRVSQEAAAGILVAALGALESHFVGKDSLPKPHFSLDKSGLM
ncbi:MAG TPA: hypothetical protein VF007_11990 [Stellaceae bacterium]